jgi:hypothetical protein
MLMTGLDITPNQYLVETEKSQKVLNSSKSMAGFHTALNLYQRCRYSGRTEDFSELIRLKSCPESGEKSLKHIS